MPTLRVMTSTSSRRGSTRAIDPRRRGRASTRHRGLHGSHRGEILRLDCRRGRSAPCRPRRAPHPRVSGDRQPLADRGVRNLYRAAVGAPEIEEAGGQESQRRIPAARPEGRAPRVDPRPRTSRLPHRASRLAPRDSCRWCGRQSRPLAATRPITCRSGPTSSGRPWLQPAVRGAITSRRDRMLTLRLVG